MLIHTARKRVSFFVSFSWKNYKSHTEISFLLLKWSMQYNVNEYNKEIEKMQCQKESETLTLPKRRCIKERPVEEERNISFVPYIKRKQRDRVNGEGERGSER